MSNLILIIVAILTIITALLVILYRTKILTIKKNGVVIFLYALLILGVIYILLALFGGPVWDKITAYQERVLSESEEECKRDDAPFGVIYKFMSKNVKKLVVVIIFIFIVKWNPVTAEVYGGSFWEAIGLGNMSCQEFTAKSKESGYKELGAVWLSGFMSGVNFTSEDVYDITWGEDIYVLTDLVIKRCEENPDKLLSDIATQIVYNRYQDKNFTATQDIENK